MKDLITSYILAVISLFPFLAGMYLRFKSRLKVAQNEIQKLTFNKTFLSNEIENLKTEKAKTKVIVTAEIRGIHEGMHQIATYKICNEIEVTSGNIENDLHDFIYKFPKTGFNIISTTVTSVANIKE